MKFLHLLSGKNFAVIDLNGGIEFNPFGEGGLGKAVIFAELDLCFAVLMKRNQRLFEIFIIFV